MKEKHIKQQQQKTTNEDRKEQRGTEAIVNRSEINDFVAHSSYVFSA